MADRPSQAKMAAEDRKRKRKSVTGGEKAVSGGGNGVRLLVFVEKNVITLNWDLVRVLAGMR